MGKYTPMFWLWLANTVVVVITGLVLAYFSQSQTSDPIVRTVVAPTASPSATFAPTVTASPSATLTPTKGVRR